MTLTITLQPEVEERLREEARRQGLTPEQLATQRLMEAELLWRIRTAAPDSGTRHLHRLLRKHKNGSLSQQEQIQIQTLLDKREERGAQRLQDLALLSQLRSLPVRQLMEQLGIHPIATP